MAGPNVRPTKRVYTPKLIRYLLCVTLNETRIAEKITEKIPKKNVSYTKLIDE
jgi:hypothetical protein